ncbi:MAG: VanZ family protein [Clostridia bacterium]|nr:VanZ family protein [Clostridia bacterium]
MRAKKILIVIDILLILATVVFIISNSAISSEKSNNTSEGVTDKVVESVKPLKDAIEQEKVDKEDIHKGVRKIAHILEYALLGAELMALLLLIAPAEPMRYLIYALFFGLALAVCDESVQKLTDRTRSTTDVMIDFCGLCIGIALAYFAFVVIRPIIKRKTK